MLTQDKLKELITYNPDTGIFIRKNGARAGTINNRNYERVSVSGINYLAHRLAFLYMTGEMPDEMVDHINGKTLDNRWCNLRKANKYQNAQNTKHPTSEEYL